MPFLPHLPALGWRATPLARTLAVCEGLAFDGVSFGWRMVHSGGRGARESALAKDRLLSDINLLADRVGAQKKRFTSGVEGSAAVYKIQLVGPLTLAASIYLPAASVPLVMQGRAVTCWSRSWKAWNAGWVLCARLCKLRGR